MLIRTKTRQETSFLLTRIFKVRWHHCFGHSRCVMAGSSPCCDRSHPGARGDSAPTQRLRTMSAHPAYPHRDSSGTEGSNSAAPSSAPHLTTGTHSCSWASPLGGGTLAQGGVRQKSGSGTWINWPGCVKTNTSWWALRVPWMFSSHLLPLGASFNLRLYLTPLIAATLTLYFQCFKCT